MRERESKGDRGREDEMRENVGLCDTRDFERENKCDGKGDEWMSN